jgi:hypothetical protein
MARARAAVTNAVLRAAGLVALRGCLAADLVLTAAEKTLAVEQSAAMEAITPGGTATPPEVAQVVIPVSEWDRRSEVFR